LTSSCPVEIKNPQRHSRGADKVFLYAERMVAAWGGRVQESLGFDTLHPAGEGLGTLLPETSQTLASLAGSSSMRTESLLEGIYVKWGTIQPKKEILSFVKM
jgi:hypothetical protein